MSPATVISRIKKSVAALLRPAPSDPQVQLDPLAAGRQAFLTMADRARAAGVDRPLLWLSFDCDTDGDAAAAGRLDPWLREHGIRASYAVPGVQLERAREIYRQLAASGAEFLNHGYQAHTAWRDGRYHPVTFYERMSADAVVADIQRGHEAVIAVTGAAPRGFRAPHFGSFQAPEHLALVHREARRLGYSYCSTTVPQFGLDHGPVVECDGLCEFPLSGSLRTPALILDSWCHLEDRVNYRLSDDYFTLMKESVDFVAANRLPCLLSFYVDPVHVEGQAPFLKAIEYLLERGIESVRPDELVVARDGVSAAAAGAS